MIGAVIAANAEAVSSVCAPSEADRSASAVAYWISSAGTTLPITSCFWAKAFCAQPRADECSATVASPGARLPS